MKIGRLDTDKKIVVIAEIGNNFEGSLPLALDMIAEAAQAGADAVKFQCISPEHLADSPERLAQLKAICLPWEDFYPLRDCAENEGVEFLCTPFDVAAVEFLNPLVNAWKIAARSTGDGQIAAAVSATRKPVIQSVPSGRAKWSGSLMLHVVSEYPCSPALADLRRVRECFGYSDHTIGIDACVGAAFLGARVIEKHFTTEAARMVAETKKYKSNDHIHSATPDQFRLMVDKIRGAEVLCSRPV